MSHKFDYFKFLDDYQRFPCLWLKSDPEFKSRQKRNAAEEVLLQSSGLGTIKNLRRKIRNIRCTYNQEVSKVFKSKSTGSDSANIYTPKLMWFEYADNFLKRNNNVVRESKTNTLTTPSKNVEAILDDIKEDNEIVAELQSTCITDNVIDTNLPAVTRQSIKRNKKKGGRITNKISKIDTSLDNVVEILKLTSKQKVTTNEFTIFGNHVAAQLEKLPLHQAVVLQEQIQSILTKARLNNLGRPLSPVTNMSS